MASSSLIAVTATIIAVGVVAKLLADRFQVPSIIFLVTAGVLLGPEGVAAVFPQIDPLITPDSFGDALPSIVGLSVAIIVFEGAFHLQAPKLREAPSVTLRLVTLGAGVAFAGTTIAVRFALGADWLVAALIGALLVATGPTVITPILSVVPVRNRVQAALETEGIVNDVTAAIVAVVVFELIISEGATLAEFVVLFVERLGIGVVVGTLTAGLIYAMLQYVDLSPGNAPQNARLLVLAGALVAYGGGDLLKTEAGVAAAATAGIVLGNLHVPYEEEITDFKGDVTLVVLSFVFINLAAILDFDTLRALGVGGILIVLAIVFVIRPALVFLSARGDRFTREEKLFVSFVGPRGIIPASVATLFAVELADAGMQSAADTLVGTVFLVILATVVLEGGLARRIAETLDVIPMRVIIVGGGTVGRALADRLEDRGENVVLVETDDEQVQYARNEGHTVHIGDGTNMEELRAAGADNARTVIAATGDDDANLLIAQLVESTFDPEQILTRVNDPSNVDAFEELGVQTVSTTLATAQELDNYIERPAMARWMNELGQIGDVQEIKVTNDEIVGRSVRDLGPEMPGTSLIALVARGGETNVPDADTVLEEGDRVTIIGDREDVRESMQEFNPN
ncbi:cation:proton antiporter [Halobaculum sp. MBLA0143]|uniref:cation:proton antiporter domain-containing protein n=1 Tax=Halobaculum sp. MBLA0143 TaxID=3079933 RepID=UPI003525645E